MTSDKSLNNYIGGGVIIHMLLTCSVKKNHYGDYPSIKCSPQTPRYGLKLYQKQINTDILTLGILLPCRIVHSVNKAIYVVETVYNQGEIIFPELSNKNGHHYSLKGNWGGQRGFRSIQGTWKSLSRDSLKLRLTWLNNKWKLSHLFVLGRP